MYRNTILSLALVAACIAPTFTVAAESINLEVSGTIEPAACTATSSVGNRIDYGSIQASSLNVDGPTWLDETRVILTLSCDSPVRAAWNVIDNRAGTARTDLISVIGGADPGAYFYGLGTAPDGTPIGGLQIQHMFQRGDGVDKNYKSSLDGGQTWIPNNKVFIDPNVLYSIAETYQSTYPDAYQIQTLEMDIWPQIGPTNDLPTSQSIPFAGDIAFEVVYI